jgi:putative hydrolase of HD superfamily
MDEKNIIRFLLEVGKLKKVKRTGWLLKGIKEPESVAEHSLRVAIMAMILSDERDLDKFRLLKMALIHDLAESIISDIVWEHGKISDFEKLKTKHKKELNAATEICSKIPNGNEFFSLIEDYLNKKSKEAKFLKEIDKLEMVIQALEYEHDSDHSLEEFWENVEEYIKDKGLVKIYEQLKLHRRNNHG